MNADNNTAKWNISKKTVRLPLFFALFFYAVAFWLYCATGASFYLYNFGYIGTALALGIFFSNALPKKHVLWGRRIAQMLIGSYMLVFVGFILRENMQLEGFFFYLLMGLFAGATLHYFLAKVAGTLIFGRGWCGWACWTAMLLDLLPWKKPRRGRLQKAGRLRYVHFFISLALVLFLWYGLGQRHIYNQSISELYWLAAGNLLYYGSGALLALVLHDNRAFCKYLCPIPVLQKIGARYALLKLSINAGKCTECGLCEKMCPMDIKLLAYKRNGQRVLSTECIMCVSCVNSCPHRAVDLTARLDSGKEHLNYRDEGEVVRTKTKKDPRELSQ